MKVARLIKQLSELDPEANVVAWVEEVGADVPVRVLIHNDGTIEIAPDFDPQSWLADA